MKHLTGLVTVILKYNFSYQNIWTYTIYRITANKINLLQQIEHSGTMSLMSQCDRREILRDGIDKSFATS